MRTRPLLVGLAGLAVLGFGAGDAVAGGGGCHDPGPTEGATEVVELQEGCMRPGTNRVEPGTRVTFVNRDQMLHNLYGTGWFHGDLAPGDEATRVFDEPGTFAYACTLHPGMVGAVVVEDPELIASSTGPGGDGDGGLALVATLGGVALLGAGFAGGRRIARRPAD